MRPGQFTYRDLFDSVESLLRFWIFFSWIFFLQFAQLCHWVSFLCPEKWFFKFVDRRVCWCELILDSISPWSLWNQFEACGQSVDFKFLLFYFYRDESQFFRVDSGLTLEGFGEILVLLFEGWVFISEFINEFAESGLIFGVGLFGWEELGLEGVDLLIEFGFKLGESGLDGMYGVDLWLSEEVVDFLVFEVYLMGEVLEEEIFFSEKVGELTKIMLKGEYFIIVLNKFSVCFFIE